LLDVRGVTLQYKTREFLVTATYRVDFQVQKSERFVILGPSGCGKTTLLKAVGGYLQPTEGTMSLSGEMIKRPGPDRVFVFPESTSCCRGRPSSRTWSSRWFRAAGSGAGAPFL